MLPAMLERLRGLHPEGAAEVEHVHAAAWNAADPVLLELARLRVAGMLGDEAARAWHSPAATAAGLDEAKAAAVDEWHDAPQFTAAERAHLAFTEQFVTSVSHVSDADVDALLDHGGPQEVYAFIGALYVMEMSMRLDMVARLALGPEVAAS